MGTVASRNIPELSKFQEGETSSAGASSSAVAVRVAAPFKYKWVSKAVGYAVVGSLSLAACEQKRGVGLADQEYCEVGLVPQTTPIIAPGCLGGPNEAGVTLAISILVPNAFGNQLGV